jgi:hypothetical protein
MLQKIPILIDFDAEGLIKELYKSIIIDDNSYANLVNTELSKTDSLVCLGVCQFSIIIYNIFNILIILTILILV